MISFAISLIALLLGYFLYGRFVERVFVPDANRPTPAIAMADGVDYIPMPGWKIFMIQFLNIAGTGPIFGAIMGAKFGPAAYLWIVFGCIFAGAVHDYLTGMLSVRHGGANLPELVGIYLGKHTKQVMLAFSVLLLLMVGVVFVYSPAEILARMGGTEMLWIVVIFVYYILATMLPIDKIIGKFYPVFAFALLFMAAALMVVLFVKTPQLPEFWDGLGNWGTERLGFTEQLFPCLFITIACGAISGFHGTQSPLMARCITNEKQGRAVFYGAMVAEGVVALIWATVAMYFFYNEPQPGYELLSGVTSGAQSSSPAVVTIVCQNWLGVVGSVLAILGVVAAPITSGDTAFRSARLIIAEALHLEQKSIHKRFYIALPMFGVAILLLLWHMGNANGFQTLWNWFGWSNQTLAVFTLWTATVFLVKAHKPFQIALIPALFMTVVCATFLLISNQAFGMGATVSYIGGGVVFCIAAVWFAVWYANNRKK
ncbi:MAG: carbon starvation protein A [Prevotella sp.]|nr:carbon starvation protein A [Prevotella sp.]